MINDIDLVIESLVKNENYKLYIVDCDNADYEEAQSYAIIASCEMNAKLHSCIKGGFSPLHISIEEYEIGEKVLV